MLETIREYGLEALEASGETQMVLRRHAAYYLDRARLAEEQLRGVGQSTALAELATEHDNIRAALRWARGSHENDLGLGLELAARVWRFWLLNGNLSEGRAWLEDALKQPQAVDAGVLARALVAAGELACAAGDLRSAMGHSDRSLAFYRAIHDDTGIAQSLHIRGYCIASRAQSDAEYLEAATLQRECLELERRRGDRAGVAKAQHALGEIARYSQNYSDAWTRLHAAWRERKELVDRDGEGWSAHCLAWVAYERGVDLPLALEWADRALSVWESFPSESRHGRSATRSLRARIAVRLGDRQAAIADVLESLTLWPLLRYTDWLIYDLLALALVATSPEPTSETAYSAAVLLSAARALHTDAVRPPKHRRREPLRIWNQIRPHLGIDRRAAARSQGRRMDAEAAHAFASDLARQLRLDATGHDSHPAA
jgi:tetratricopeptide (TPR) repeat protein